MNTNYLKATTLLLAMACKPSDFAKVSDDSGDEAKAETVSGNESVKKPCIPTDLYEVSHRQPTIDNSYLWQDFNDGHALSANCWLDNVKDDASHYMKKVMLCGVVVGNSFDANYVAEELMESFRDQGFNVGATKNEGADIVVSVAKPQTGDTFYAHGNTYLKVYLRFDDEAFIPTETCKE